jgi:hypothetical protein
MSYVYAVRGWLELSWPDAEFEGVDESPEEHADKVQRVRQLLLSELRAEQASDPAIPALERARAGWGFPQQVLEGTEYVFYGGDVEDPALVLAQVREVLRIDPFADGYFSIEGEDGEQFRQWLIKSGKIYARRLLFPDFDSDSLPAGYAELPPSASS